MEERDRRLLDTLRQSNEELDRLWLEHGEFEAKLGALNKRHARTPAEDQEILRLKRLKLQGRDRIEAILSQHRI